MSRPYAVCMYECSPGHQCDACDTNDYVDKLQAQLAEIAEIIGVEHDTVWCNPTKCKQCRVKTIIKGDKK